MRHPNIPPLHILTIHFGGDIPPVSQLHTLENCVKYAAMVNGWPPPWKATYRPAPKYIPRKVRSR